MSAPNQLGDLQLAIMRVLWQQGEATVADVHRALLDERGLALTTIATMLSKMEKKGVVKHRRAGRQFVYQATVAEDEVQVSMVEDLTNRLFDGDVSALVSHLLEAHEIDRDELSRLKQLIAQHEQKGRNHVA